MTHDYVHLEWSKFSKVKWRLDLLVNCHNMDALWGFMVQARE